jgi:hypothetical protein
LQALIEPARESVSEYTNEVAAAVALLTTSRGKRKVGKLLEQINVGPDAIQASTMVELANQLGWFDRMIVHYERCNKETLAEIESRRERRGIIAHESPIRTIKNGG